VRRFFHIHLARRSQRKLDWDLRVTTDIIGPVSHGPDSRIRIQALGLDVAQSLRDWLSVSEKLPYNDLGMGAQL